MVDTQASPPARSARSRPSRPEERLRARLGGGDTFFLLFFALLVSLALLIAATDIQLGRLAGQMLTGGSLILAVTASHASRTWRIMGWLALAGAVFSTLAGEYFDLSAVSALVGLLFTVLLFASVPLILSRLARHERVTGETVAGALCVYLLLGMAFANINLALSFVQQNPVLMSSNDPGSAVARGDFYYYSFITMATVGFGDIVPVTNPAKTLAVFQAVLGQLFLVTIVARLVSSATFKRSEFQDTAEATTEDIPAAPQRSTGAASAQPVSSRPAAQPQGSSAVNLAEDRPPARRADSDD